MLGKLRLDHRGRDVNQALGNLAADLGSRRVDVSRVAGTALRLKLLITVLFAKGPLCCES